MTFTPQKLIRKYISDKSPYRGVLVFHGLGTGKTCTAINAAIKTDRKVVLLIPASIKNTWLREIPYCGGKGFRYPKNFIKCAIKHFFRQIRHIMYKLSAILTFVYCYKSTIMT